MAVKYTDDQLVVIKRLMEICGSFADQILHIMQNHDLCKVKGTKVKIEVDPAYPTIVKMIEFGDGIEAESGHIKMTKGMEEKEYGAIGKNSAEYEILFAPPEVAERIREVLKRAHPICPDGMWIGDDRNLPPLDCRGREIRFEDCTPVPGKIGGAENDSMVNPG